MSTLKSFLSSFGAAGKGIVCTIREERNFRFHLTAAFYVFCLRGFYGEYFSFSHAEDAVLFLTIGAVFAMELLNTAVENAVDHVLRNFTHWQEKQKMQRRQRYW